ncbi:MAG: hypothetical protein ABI700_33770, partial [Chloroflexota bacterium]
GWKRAEKTGRDFRLRINAQTEKGSTAREVQMVEVIRATSIIAQKFYLSRYFDAHRNSSRHFGGISRFYY